MIKKIIFGSACLLFLQTQALIVGSFTAPSRQAAINFPTGVANNEMRGFAAFENGFSLADASTTCSFNSYFPVSGLVNMRGGILNLNVDMSMGNNTSIVSTGTINGAGFGIHTPSAQQYPFVIPMNTPNVTVYDNHIGLAANNLSVDWSINDAYTATGMAGTTPGISIVQWNATTLTPTQVTTANTAGNCSSVRWHPTLYYLAAASQTTGAGSVQTYLFTPPSTLTLKANITSGTNAYAVAWHPSGNYLAAGFSNGISVYSFNSSTGNLTLLSSDVQTGHAVSLNAITWSSDGLYVVAGYATAAAYNELRVDSFNGATLTPVASYRIGATVECCSWSTKADFIAVGLLTGIANTLRMFQFTRSTNTLTDLASSYVGETSTVFDANWSPDGQSIVVGLAGTTPTTIRVYNFNPYNDVLTLVSANTLATAGQSAVRWSRQSSYIVTGDGTSTYTSYYTISLPYYLINLKMVLNSDVAIYGIPTFQGNCVIDGNGYKLDISGALSFLISSGATVLLKNMNLYGIVGTNINFVDTTGVLQLQDMTWTQTGDYAFTNGALTINGDVLFTGTSNFIYSSGKTSTINSNATLMFDNGMTFSYAPSTSNNSLLAMADNTSNLYLLNTTLFCANTGLKLTQGNLIIEGLCPVISAAINSSQGILIGDGLSAANNLTTMVLAESGLNVQSGFVVYNNV